MDEPITGTMTPRISRGRILSTIHYEDCNAALSTGERIQLTFRGNGRKRVYYVIGEDGSVIAQSSTIHTSGLRSWFVPGVRFLDSQGRNIMEYRGFFFPAGIHFGTIPVRCRHVVKKWFRDVFQSELFEFEQPCMKSHSIFSIADGRYLIPSLCCGYMDYVFRSENPSCGD